MMRFLLSEHLKAVLRARRESRAHIEPFERDNDAILLVGDVGGVAYLTMKGDIFKQDWDFADVVAQAGGYDPPYVKVVEAIEAYALLTIAAEDIPELATLLPERPATAPSCEKCAGAGWYNIGPEIRLVCDWCGGLGWPPNHSLQRTRP